MKEEKEISTNINDLRFRAEEKLKTMWGKDPSYIMDIEALRIFTELQIHQIELELQNDEIKNAKDDLESSLAMYTELYDFAPQGYFSLDSYGNICRVNLTGANILGVTRSQLLGVHFGQFVSPDTLPTFNTFLKNLFISQTKQKTEVLLITETGVSINVLVEAVYPGDGDECRIAVIDITELIHAKNELEKSNKNVMKILESISDAFFTLDEDWRFTYVNNEAERIMKKKREQLIGSIIWKQFYEACDTLWQTEFQEVMLTKISSQFECYYPPLDKWFEIRAYPYEGGLSVYFRDCSERRAKQDCMANASKRYAYIAEILQKTLIPLQIPTDIKGYEIAARYQPALSEAEVCGDFYDLFDLCEGRLGIIVGDIVGKGVKAAARVAAVRHTIRSYAYIDKSVSGIMKLVHDALVRDIESENDMLTVFFAVLDTRENKLTYTNAGHEPPLLMHSDGNIEYLNISGPMISGVKINNIYLECSLSIQMDDVLVLITDGITEAWKDNKSELFGPEGIERCLLENIKASAEDTASNILEEAKSFAHKELRDDVAIVVIKKV